MSLPYSMELIVAPGLLAWHLKLIGSPKPEPERSIEGWSVNARSSLSGENGLILSR